LAVAWASELAYQILDVLFGGPQYADALEVFHVLAIRILEQIEKVDLFGQYLRLAVDDAYHADLEQFMQTF